MISLGLSEEMVTDGYCGTIVNIDISSVVIDAVKKEPSDAEHQECTLFLSLSLSLQSCSLSLTSTPNT